MPVAYVVPCINLIPEIPNVVFVPGRISEGKTGCAYTWKVVVNGQDGPSGISFKEVDATGKVSYNRDIPAPEWPRPLGRLATKLRPQLRTFRPRAAAPSMRLGRARAPDSRARIECGPRRSCGHMRAS